MPKSPKPQIHNQFSTISRDLLRHLRLNPKQAVQKKNCQPLSICKDFIVNRF